MHHANLLVGAKAWAYTLISPEDRTPGLDVVVYDDPSFTIAHARALTHTASMKPVEKEYRVFIIACDSILHEAQNALLKIFEEPNPNTIFYLILPQEDLLLPTLRSRLHVLAREGIVEEDAVFEDFRKASYKERLERIQEKLSSEDTAWVERLMSGMEVYAHKHRDPNLMREVLRTVSYLRAPGSSKKMLLEHLALTL